MGIHVRTRALAATAASTFLVLGSLVASRAGTAAAEDAAGATAGDPVLAAAGSIACDPARTPANEFCHAAATADLLPGSDAVVALGDNQYRDGSLASFRAAYDATWGRFKSITRPVPGDHEYETPAASGYFTYFGAAAGAASKGYYSYDLGAWHVVALNSNCSEVGGCGARSAQAQWLRADLADHPNACTLAYWHRPRFSSGADGGADSSSVFWEALYRYGADVVLGGHDHDYERFAPQTPSGALDPARGIREFVVGTGGKSLAGFSGVRPNSEARGADAYGVLKLTLHPSSYDWTFASEAGSTYTDAGSDQCVTASGVSPVPDGSSGGGEPSPTTAPPAPGSSGIYRAFTQNSYWNTPLPADAPVDPRSNEFISYLVADNDVNFVKLSGTDTTGLWGNPIYWAGAADPASNVVNSCTTRQPEEFNDIRIPATAAPDPTADAAMTVYDVERGIVYGMHWAKRESGTWSACGGTAYRLGSNGLSGNLPQSDDRRNTGHRGVPPPVYAVRYDEIRAGALEHVLKISVAAASPKYVFPMVGSDGESTDISAPPEGSRLRIKPSVDLRQFNLSPAALVIARALQKYGAIIGDESGGTVNLKVENTVAEGRGDLWKGVLQATSLSAIPLDAYEVVRLGYGG